MYRVAWLTCALLALAGARTYDRCELARELQALGVRPDHISTWVCIAYHESRFNTAAKNPYSGDHGIFQISELYWCGPGKACGLPCSALRDDDISDDLECALQVHEEHTRLQGNGFLAWVVYPQHCKHNTKKYLVDCDTSLKYTVPITRSRTYYYEDSYNKPNFTYDRPNIENLLPPYLAIGSIFRGHYGKVLDQNTQKIDWYNYKINNIDDLKLPVFDKPSQPYSFPPPSTTTSTTTTTTYIPPVKPWRTIETNQFRKKHKPTTANDFTTQSEKITPSSRLTAYTIPTTTIRPASLQNATSTTLRPTSITTTSYSPTTTSALVTNWQTYLSTTQRPTSTSVPRDIVTYRSHTITEKPINTILPKDTVTTTYKPRSENSPSITQSSRNFVFTTFRPSLTTTANPSTVTTYPRNIVTTTYRPWTTITEKPTSTTLSPWNSVNTTYKSWFTNSFRPTTTKQKLTSTSRNALTTTYKPWITTTVRPTTTSISPRNTVTTTYRPWFTTTGQQRSTTEKPTTTRVTTKRIETTTYRPRTTTTQTPTTTTRPTTGTFKTARTVPPTTERPVTTTNKAITKTDYSWYTFTSRTATTPPTTKKQTTQSYKPASFATQTKINAQYGVNQPVTYSTSTSKSQPTTPKPKSTQSIFDLYLNPTKPPKLPRYSPPENKYRLKIFASGTTTPASIVPARNYIRRQALRDSHNK